MNKILSWTSGISIAIICATVYLYHLGLIPRDGRLLFFLPMIVGSIYSIWIDSFWKKISSDTYTDEHFNELVRMMIRHRKDEKTLRVILYKLSSEDMSGPLQRNYVWAIRCLLDGDKGKRYLLATIRTICDLTRKYSVKRFEDEVKKLEKKYPLDEENEEFIDLFNNKMMQCFLDVGGYPTWTYVEKIVLPIFENVSKDTAERFLIKVEKRYVARAILGPDRFQVGEARTQVFLSLRHRIIQRKTVVPT